MNASPRPPRRKLGVGSMVLVFIVLLVALPVVLITAWTVGGTRRANATVASAPPTNGPNYAARLRGRLFDTKLVNMSTLTEIATAIEQLPTSQVDELAAWLEEYRARRATSPSADDWLDRARGAARPGVTTAEVMALTRGEE
jgi:hypothetical protein